MSRVILKLCMWFLVIGFGSNYMMQTISYSFYKHAKQIKDISCQPEIIQFNESLSGYGCHLKQTSEQVILFFGGSNDIAYNSVGKYGNQFKCPFISVDYYGTQRSKGKMNLQSMQQSAEDLYDWVVTHYGKQKIIVMGHSYGTGMATYLASSRKCDALVLLSGYRDLADLYNKILPVFWGPLKVFISDNIKVYEYAKTVQCPTYIIGSKADRTLNSTLQEKVAGCFKEVNLKIFEDISHESYLLEEAVIQYIEVCLEI